MVNNFFFKAVTIFEGNGSGRFSEACEYFPSIHPYPCNMLSVYVLVISA